MSENKHDELLALLNPLVDFMNKNGFSYFLVAGKDGTCSRFMNGDFYDLSGMITSFAQDHKNAKGMLEHALKDIE